MDMEKKESQDLENSYAPLTPERLNPLLKTERLGRHCVYYEETESTLSDAKELAANDAPDGTVIVAEFQGSGRGRFSRGWFSPKGKNVLVNLLLRPAFLQPTDAPKCTLLSSVAVAETMRDFGVDAAIKWPNDVICAGKKITGMLTEMHTAGNAVDYISIGIGMNVNMTLEECPEEIRDKVMSMRIATGHIFDRATFLAAFLKHFEELWQTLARDGFAPILAAWRELSITLGQEVQVVSGAETFTGKAVDIDDFGALLVDTTEGRRRVLAADVSVRAAGGQYA